MIQSTPRPALEHETMGNYVMRGHLRVTRAFQLLNRVGGHPYEVHIDGKLLGMRFAHLKTHHGFERMRLRGLSGVRDEFHLAAIIQNLKMLALRLIRPP